jgi:phage gp36-like protein
MVYYGTRTDVEQVFGRDNIRKWSNLDNVDAETDDGRVAEAMTQASAEIDTALLDGPYSTPLTGMSATTQQLVKTLWAKLAGVWLYANRGQKDDGGEEGQGNRYAKMDRDVRRELRMIKSGVYRIQASRRWPMPNSPAAADPTM